MANKIIAIAGRMGSGKDVCATHLIENHQFVKYSFAGSLKDAVSVVFGWDRVLLEGETPESRVWRETIDQWWANRLSIKHLTPRWVLQNWGTEVCRQGFHQDIWVASLENKLSKINENVVITDCRFKNEFDTVKNVGGICIRLERGPEPEWYPIAADYNTTGYSYDFETLKKYNIHASEYSSVGLDYDYCIENNSDLPSLFTQLESIINR